MFAKMRIQTNVWKSSVDCCSVQNIPFVPPKRRKRLGKKPNELTEEILALCPPYFVFRTPEYRSICKQDEKETGTGCMRSVAYEDLAVIWVQRVDLCNTVCEVSLMPQVQKNIYSHFSQIFPIPSVYSLEKYYNL